MRGRYTGERIKEEKEEDPLITIAFFRRVAAAARLQVDHQKKVGVPIRCSLKFLKMILTSDDPLYFSKKLNDLVTIHHSVQYFLSLSIFDGIKP